MNVVGWLAAVILSCVLLDVSLLRCVRVVSAFVHPSPLSSGPWRSLTTEELSGFSEPMAITSPVELAGSMLFQGTPVAGNLFLVDEATIAADGYRLTDLPLRLPHSADDPTACGPLTRNVTDEGETIGGSLLLIERGGGCTFTEKVLHAAALALDPHQPPIVGIVLFGCDGTDPRVTQCNVADDGLIGLSAFGAYSLPSIYLAASDGQQLKRYLRRRRETFLNVTAHGGPPAACLSDPTLRTSASAALAGGCVLPPVLGSVLGTGPLVDPHELVALRQLAAALVFDPTYVESVTWLRAWSSLLNSDSDPCVDRIVGLWCAGGHVTAIDLTDDGVSGTLPAGALRPLTQLRFLILVFLSLDGPIPSDICALDQLRVLAVEGNAFTSLPECIGGGAADGQVWPGAQSLQSLLASKNQLTNLPLSLAALNATMLILVVSENRISGDLWPLLALRRLVVLEAYSNPDLVLDFDAHPHDPFFRGWTQVTSILLSQCGLSGTLPVSAFDGCVDLTAVDLSSSARALGGPLPTFAQCSALESISLDGNAFTGGMPATWPTDLAASLVYLSLESNQLGGGVDASASWSLLGRLAKLEVLRFGHNQLTGVDPTDVGQSLWLLTGTSLTELHLNHNNLSGPWLTNQLIASTVRVLNVAGNRIENLPDTLWAVALVDIDFSDNALTGTIPSAPTLVSQRGQGQARVNRAIAHATSALVWCWSPTRRCSARC